MLKGVASTTIVVLSILISTWEGVQWSSIRPVSVEDVLRQKLRLKPSNSSLHSKLALQLAYGGAAAQEDSASAADQSLHHPFILNHERLDEMRAISAAALEMAPESTAALRAQMAVLMAEGRAEESLQPGMKAIRIDPNCVDANKELARAHLGAGCAQACQARTIFREEKKKPKYDNTPKPKEEERGGGGGRPPRDIGSLRAGSMWRIMEAGRLYKQAAAIDPSDKELKELSQRTLSLRTANAHSVMNIAALLSAGQCDVFYGKELDGELCDKPRYKFD